MNDLKHNSENVSTVVLHKLQQHDQMTVDELGEMAQERQPNLIVQSADDNIPVISSAQQNNFASTNTSSVARRNTLTNNTKPGEGWASTAVFQLGRGKTLAVPMTVHESARKKLFQAFHVKGIKNGVVLLQGGEDQNVYDTDTELLFRYKQICLLMQFYHFFVLKLTTRLFLFGYSPFTDRTPGSTTSSV